MSASCASQGASPASPATNGLGAQAAPFSHSSSRPVKPTLSRVRRSTMTAAERTMIGCNRPEQRKNPRYKLTENQLHQVQIGVNAALESLGLVRRESFRPSQRWFDELAVEANTRRAYDKQLRGLLYFFGLIGDYESLIFLLPDAPTNVPAMNVDSICKENVHVLASIVSCFY